MQQDSIIEEKSKTIIISNKPTTTLPSLNRPDCSPVQLVWTEQDRSKAGDNEGEKVYEWYPFLAEVNTSKITELFGAKFVEDLLIAKLKQLFQQHWFKSSEQEIDEFFKIMESEDLSARKETAESCMRKATKLIKEGRNSEAQVLMLRAQELLIETINAAKNVPTIPSETVAAKLVITK